MKLICKALGGSHSYGLNTPDSDQDVRGIFLNTDMRYILGLDKYEYQEYTDGGKDDKYKEFRHFMKLLRQGNTEAIEMLFHDDWIELSDAFKAIQAQKHRLIDSEKLYRALKGYMQGERRLANGDRTGTLGGKRKETIDKYSFSPKNFVQLLRLAWAGRIFFQRGYFPVNVMKWDGNLARELLSIKLRPWEHTKKELNERVDTFETKLDEAFHQRDSTYEFDQQLADRLVLQMYYPVIKEEYENIKS